MKIIFAGNGNRGIACLQIINDLHDIVGVIGNNNTNNKFIIQATKLNLLTFQPEDVNNQFFIDKIKKLKADICILAGYGKIIKKSFISITKNGCINLHAGKLPNYRGSSPMNWALINGEGNYSLSIIKVDEGVDTGPILIEKSILIEENQTILDLHKTANKQFPNLLLGVLEKIENKTIEIFTQNNKDSSYYPLRFPSDGIIFFDQLTALEIHNRVRALTEPYPGVISYYNNKKIKIISSLLTNRPFFGEPGRIYRISKKGVLVCAKDKCLWLTKVIDNKTGDNIDNKFKRYEMLGTIKEAARRIYENQ